MTPDPDYGSTLVNSIPAGLKHQCFMAELHRRLGAQGEHAMAHAASNPMAIKRASDATFEAIIGQARKGLTPRRARKVRRKGNGEGREKGRSGDFCFSSYMTYVFYVCMLWGIVKTGD